MGEALGEASLQRLAKPEFAGACLQDASLPASEFPVTVHVAVGTDTPHTHPPAEGAAIG